MSVCYSTSLTITGKKKELISVLKYLNNITRIMKKYILNVWKQNLNLKDSQKV